MLGVIHAPLVPAINGLIFDPLELMLDPAHPAIPGAPSGDYTLTATEDIERTPEGDAQVYVLTAIDDLPNTNDD